MKTIELYKKDDPEYEEVCLFARRIYSERLSFTITHLPEYFFAINSKMGITGCIGLNSKLTSPLFLNDQRVMRVVSQSGQCVQFCEQSIFAIDHFSLGAPLLIAVIAEFAHSLGMQKLVYAGADSFRKILTHLNFSITECGPVDLSTLPFADRKKYELWNQTQNPIVCILDTQEAATASFSLFRKHSHRVQKGRALTESIFANLTPSRQKETCLP